MTDMYTREPIDRPGEGDFSSGASGKVWRLQFGPCWCRGVPSNTASFDFVRLVTSETDLGGYEKNVLIVSERVIDGAMPMYRQVLERIPTPRLVVSAAACPAAGRFWDELPLGWAPVWDTLPVDVRIEECISGMPEALMAAVVRHVTRVEARERPQDLAVGVGG